MEVEPRVLDLIVYLAAQAPRVVTRDELLEKVWRGASVSDAALSRAVREARRALGDDGAAQRIIKTVHGRGYSFVATERRADAAPARPPASLGATAFFGRGSHLERLVGLAEACVRGAGAVVLVEGEAGIGKSCLLDQLLVRASELELAVASGRCSAAEGAPALWPWVQVLRALESGLGEGALEALDGAAWAILAPHVGRAASAPHLDDPFPVIDATGRLLAACARQRPLLVAVDDLHVADSGSRAMATWLANELAAERVLLLLTTRDGGRGLPLAAPLGDVLRERAHRLRLEGLDRESVRAWLAVARGEEVSDAVVRQVTISTGGNPLHIRQLLWSAEGAELDRVLSDGLPRELREAIAVRLGRLPPSKRDVLVAAAVAGSTFTTGGLASGLDRPIDEVLPAVESLLAEGWLRRSTEVVGTLELPHAAIRAAIYEAVEPSERMQHHDRMGRALAAAAGNGASVERAAYHLTRAAPATRVELGVEYAHRAALEAFHKGAYDRCAAFCEAALDGMGLADRPFPARREVALLLASAKGRDGDLAAAAVLFRGAARLTEVPHRAHPLLDQRELAIVRDTLAAVVPRLEPLVERIYDLLFTRHPAVKGLFQRNRPELQVVMLAETLTSIIDHYEDTPWLDETLSRLGRGHVHYGVTDEMFGWLGEALLDSLREELGEQWSADVAGAWEHAFQSISAIMIGAMRDTREQLAVRRLARA